MECQPQEASSEEVLLFEMLPFQCWSCQDCCTTEFYILKQNSENFDSGTGSEDKYCRKKCFLLFDWKPQPSWFSLNWTPSIACTLWDASLIIGHFCVLRLMLPVTEGAVLKWEKIHVGYTLFLGPCMEEPRENHLWESTGAASGEENVGMAPVRVAVLFWECCFLKSHLPPSSWEGRTQCSAAEEHKAICFYVLFISTSSCQFCGGLFVLFCIVLLQGGAQGFLWSIIIQK